MKTPIDPLLMVGVRSVQRDVAAAQKAYQQFMEELFRRYDLDPAKNYFFADDGTVTEVQSVDQVRHDVQEIYDGRGNNNGGH